MEYTKGEWTATKTVTSAEVGVDDDVIADVYSCHTGIALVNAHLIAAAPDMYKALKTLNEQLMGANIPFSQNLFDAKRNARQALSKAEGKP